MGWMRRRWAADTQFMIESVAAVVMLIVEMLIPLFSSTWHLTAVQLLPEGLLSTMLL